MTTSTSIYDEVRPTDLGGVIGQPAAVNVLQGFFKKKRVPHALLFTGPSGCGKTTLARIAADKVGCNMGTDYYELDTAQFTGIETIRNIRRRMRQAPMIGKSRVWCLDECHQLSSDAQDGLLKLLESPPPHVYFMLCTTAPDKLKPTIVTRCNPVEVVSIPPDALAELVQKTAKAVKAKVSGEVLDKLVEVADGSARKALVLLESIAGMETEEDQLQYIQSKNAKEQAITVARMLINTKTSWPEMCEVLADVNEKPETIRRMVLSYFAKVLLNGRKNGRALFVIQVFRDHWYDCDRAGLVASCYEVVHGEER